MPDKDKSIKIVFDEQLLEEIIAAVLEFEGELCAEDDGSNDVMTSKDMQVLNTRTRWYK